MMDVCHKDLTDVFNTNLNYLGVESIMIFQCIFSGICFIFKDTHVFMNVTDEEQLTVKYLKNGEMFSGITYHDNDKYEYALNIRCHTYIPYLPNRSTSGLLSICLNSMSLNSSWSSMTSHHHGFIIIS